MKFKGATGDHAGGWLVYTAPRKAGEAEKDLARDTSPHRAEGREEAGAGHVRQRARSLPLDPGDGLACLLCPSNRAPLFAGEGRVWCGVCGGFPALLLCLLIAH